jgi:hypothetical protein
MERPVMGGSGGGVDPSKEEKGMVSRGCANMKGRTVC